jgi:hypothetical protein
VKDYLRLEIANGGAQRIAIAHVAELRAEAATKAEPIM